MVIDMPSRIFIALLAKNRLQSALSSICVKLTSFRTMRRPLSILIKQTGRRKMPFGGPVKIFHR